jgi:hypothetical protein
VSFTSAITASVSGGASVKEAVVAPEAAGGGSSGKAGGQQVAPSHPRQVAAAATGGGQYPGVTTHLAGSRSGFAVGTVLYRARYREGSEHKSLGVFDCAADAARAQDAARRTHGGDPRRLIFPTAAERSAHGLALPTPAPAQALGAAAAGAADAAGTSNATGTALVGRSFSKKFGRKQFAGKVTSWDAAEELYHVVYSDGDEEVRGTLNRPLPTRTHCCSCWMFCIITTRTWTRKSSSRCFRSWRLLKAGSR